VFGQTFSPPDTIVIALLVLLEGVLSIDNALVIALLAKRLPKAQQTRALTYGLAGAFIFRIFAIATAAYLLRWRVVKLVGGGYLLWIALKHLISNRSAEDHISLGPDQTPTIVNETGRELSEDEREQELNARMAFPVHEPKGTQFWKTVVVIELTDIAFAIDSILAAIAMVGSAPAGHAGPHPKLWVVMTGGILGVILMRVAATVFIKLLDRFPRFETSAYLLVTLIGAKLVVDWGANTPEHPHRIDFHDTTSGAFWVFWLLMAVCTATGFLPQRKHNPARS
jgi:YkoY family integral membrane protein